MTPSGPHKPSARDVAEIIGATYEAALEELRLERDAISENADSTLALYETAERAAVQWMERAEAAEHELEEWRQEARQLQGKLDELGKGRYDPECDCCRQAARIIGGNASWPK